MSVQVNITGLAGDDLEYAVALTYDGAALDLGTVTSVTAYLKPTAVAPDSDGTTFGVGTGLTVTDSAAGELTWLVPHANVGLNRWYRFTVTDAQSRLSTALYGRVIITDV